MAAKPTLPADWHPPYWGNFAGRADEDLLAFAVLYEAGLMVPGFFHAAQAVEKYLKALVLALADPTGRATPRSAGLRNTHDLVGLCARVSPQYPYYGQADVRGHMLRFSEYNEVTRYAARQVHDNGFSGADVPVFEELIHHLRNDLPIVVDDYYLGMAVRGHHHGHPEAVPSGPFSVGYARATDALRRVFRDVDGLIRK